MPDTHIWYKDYDRNRLDVVFEQQRTEDVIGQSSLSSFQIPLTVTIDVRDAHYVAFIFAYPNDEPPAKIMGCLQDISNLHFVLGQRTRKILEVRFTKAHERAEARDFSFDPNKALWGKDLSDVEAREVNMNTSLIARILNGLPGDIYQQIRKALRDQRTT
jgi:hypothetical protein